MNVLVWAAHLLALGVIAALLVIGVRLMIDAYHDPS